MNRRTFLASAGSAIVASAAPVGQAAPAAVGYTFPNRPVFPPLRWVMSCKGANFYGAWGPSLRPTMKNTIGEDIDVDVRALDESNNAVITFGPIRLRPGETLSIDVPEDGNVLNLSLA
jgi:hypothetical protein